jgi:hypothetical protein
MNTTINHPDPFTNGFIRQQNFYACGIRFLSLLLLLTPGLLAAQTAVDEDSPWPRVRSTNGNSVTFYLPQVEHWTTNWFVARSVVEVQPAGAKKELLGVIWFEARGSVDRPNRLVTLDDMEITKANFPEAPDNGSNALAIVRQVFPSGARTVSLDYLITALGFEQAAARQTAQPLNHTPPDIIWMTNRAVLILVDGEPVLRPVPGAPLERVINTAALLVRDQATGRFYLSGENQQWYSADLLSGPWSLAQIPPVAVASLTPTPTNRTPAPPAAGPAPRIVVSTKPAELLMTDGEPAFRPIPGTALQYAADTDNQLFFYNPTREAYVLLSGRWFKAASLNGPWTYVAPHDLPEDFAKIPPDSPQAVVLASVPGTSQAELALVASSVPTTATVSRDTKLELAYDGDPQFKPITGTSLSYAINAPMPVIHAGNNYYALDKAVWFVASSPTGPWQVATDVPEEIYTIPPDSPVYYATFARVYDAGTNNVEVGYTPGYTGAYEDDGTMVYGTGYDYPSYTTTTTYYGWGYTWGYGYLYSPWYGWWTWRPWWNNRGGLRAALIDNVYDRWPGGNRVTPHDRVAGSAANASRWQGYSGYPAVYGRFQGNARATTWAPPASTLALNPYSRPQTSVRPGAVPGGAQLLDTVRQSPGGGRDLYASPDGNIYMRQNDGWYRRGQGGNWNYYAPAQGAGQRNQNVPAQNAQALGAQARRGTTAPGAAAAGGQVRSANAGSGARAQNATALDRQYYARQVGQARAQNTRPAARPAPVRSAPMRGGGGFRR